MTRTKCRQMNIFQEWPNVSWERTKVLRPEQASRTREMSRVRHSERSEESLFRRLKRRDLLRQRLCRVVSIPRLNEQVFLFRGHRDFVIARSFIFFRRVRQAVLVAQFLFKFGISFVYRLFFRNFVQSSAGGFGNLLQNFLSVWPL